MPSLNFSDISLSGITLAPFFVGPEFEVKEKEKFTSPGKSFAFSLDTSSNDIVVGAYSSAKAYFFTIQSGLIVQTAEFTKTGRFGFKVSMDGVWAAVTDTPSSGNGTVTVYRKVGQNWTEFTTISIPAGETGTGFASSVCINGTTMVIGHSKANTIGGAHVYVFNGTAWVRQGGLLTTQAILTRAGTSQNFGGEVAIFGDTLVVGGSGDTLGKGLGMAFISKRSGSTWSTPVVFKPATTYADGFGWSLSLVGNTLAVGAPAGSATDNHTGRVFVYNTNTSTPTLTTTFMVRKDKTAIIQDAGSSTGDNFGWAVRVSDSQLVVAVGAPNRNTNRGSAYLLEFYNGAWGPALNPRLHPIPETANSRFGSSLGFVNDGLVVGAYGTSNIFLFD